MNGDRVMTAEAKTKRNANLPSPASETLPSTAVADMMAADAGDGLSTDAADNMVSMIRVLQPMSPQVIRGNAQMIDAAMPGDIWLKGASPPVVQGEVGIVFQPAHFTRMWIEWIPRDQGGGLVAQYLEKPPEAHMVEDERRGRVNWAMPNGNEVIETRYISGL